MLTESSKGRIISFEIVFTKPSTDKIVLQRRWQRRCWRIVSIFLSTNVVTALLKEEEHLSVKESLDGALQGRKASFSSDTWLRSKREAITPDEWFGRKYEEFASDKWLRSTCQVNTSDERFSSMCEVISQYFLLLHALLRLNISFAQKRMTQPHDSHEEHEREHALTRCCARTPNMRHLDTTPSFLSWLICCMNTIVSLWSDLVHGDKHFSPVHVDSYFILVTWGNSL